MAASFFGVDLFWGFDFQCVVGAMRAPVTLGDPLVTFDRVVLSYGRHLALDQVTGAVCAGSLLAVLGPNGGGKSSFLKAFLGLSKLRSGIVRYHGVRPKHMAYLPQQLALDRSFPLRVYDAVALGLCQQRGFWADLEAAAKVRVMAALEQVGMADYVDRSLDSLSGGQFQRVLFARLAVQDSSVILLDEPFAAIDAYTTNDLMDVLKTWHGEGRTIVVVSHDLDLVRDHFPETLILARTPIAWGQTEIVMTDDHLKTARLAARSWAWEGGYA